MSLPCRASHGLRGKLWSRLAALLGAVLLLCPTVIFAQGSASWSEGARVSATDKHSTGTLSLVASATERKYRFENTDVTLALRFLRLSGERDLPMRIVEASSRRNSFEGSMGKLELTAVDPGFAIVEFETEGDIEGLAFAEIRSSNRETSSTLTQKGAGVRVIEGGQATNLNFEADRAFREQLADGFRMVAPVSGGKKVKLSITTEPFSGPLNLPVATPAPTPKPTEATALASPAAPAAATTPAAPAAAPEAPPAN